MLASEWHTLSRMTAKQEFYTEEVYFREGYARAKALWGASFDDLLKRTALLVIKPEGLVAGKAPLILDFLEEHGFSLKYCRFFEFTRLQWRELWRYQLNAATYDRLLVNDIVLQRRAAFLLLHHSDPGVLPASVLMSKLKGPSDISSQTPDCLRYRLEQPNRVFSLFHVADEPADVLRELPIFLDSDSQHDALLALETMMASPDSQKTEQYLRDMHSVSVDITDIDTALDTLELEVRTATAPDPVQSDARTNALSTIGRMRTGEKISWQEMSNWLTSLKISLDSWSVAIIATNRIQYDIPNRAKTLKGVDRSAWSDQ